MSKKILAFNWDNAKGEDYNGQHLIIGQHLPKTQNEEATHLEVYGLSLDIADNTKDYQLKRQSCFSENITSDVKEITKDEARNLFIIEIDRALDILFDESEIEVVATNLNVEETVAEIEEE
jgi:hypothetical protein